jgi:hypothetical protein
MSRRAWTFGCPLAIVLAFVASLGAREAPATPEPKPGVSTKVGPYLEHPMAALAFERRKLIDGPGSSGMDPYLNVACGLADITTKKPTKPVDPKNIIEWTD